MTHEEQERIEKRIVALEAKVDQPHVRLEALEGAIKKQRDINLALLELLEDNLDLAPGIAASVAFKI